MLLIPWGDGGKKVYYLLSFAFFLLPLPNLVLSWLNNHTCYFKIQCLCVPLSLCPFGLLLDIFKMTSPSDYYLPCGSTVCWLLRSQQLSHISQRCLPLLESTAIRHLKHPSFFCFGFFFPAKVMLGVWFLFCISCF